MNKFIGWGQEFVINLTPSAYVMIFAFIFTVIGFDILPMTITNILGVILAIKIIIVEFSMRDTLYESSRKRYETFAFNLLLLVIGMTLFSI